MFLLVHVDKQVFGTATKQTEMFDEVSSTVNSVMAGFNGTIMAYGQTSAGMITHIPSLAFIRQLIN